MNRMDNNHVNDQTEQGQIFLVKIQILIFSKFTVRNSNSLVGTERLGKRYKMLKNCSAALKIFIKIFVH